MKELSVQEKAECYDKAIDIIRKCETDKYGCVIGIKPSDIFSELKESEGERMSKYLIKYFEANKDELSKGFKWNGITVEECLTWLEKQGKLVAYYEDKLDRCACENFNKGYKKAIEIQGKQPTNEEMKELLRTEYEKGRADAIAEMQKSSWSEEDEEKRKNCIYWLEKAGKYFEQDEDLIYENKWLTKCIDWLKSLRPQNRWKPSDEQMKVLNYVVNLMASSESPKENDYYYNVFKDLRNQLKNLREE